MARRDDREYREYLKEEQRSRPLGSLVARRVDMAFEQPPAPDIIRPPDPIDKPQPDVKPVPPPDIPPPSGPPDIQPPPVPERGDVRI